MEVRIKPSFNRILVEQVDKEDPIYQRTKQIVSLIPGGEAEQDQYKNSLLFRVLDLGSRVNEINPDRHVSDVVALVNHSTSGAVSFRNKFYLLIGEQDILCTFEQQE